MTTHGSNLEICTYAAHDILRAVSDGSLKSLHNSISLTETRAEEFLLSALVLHLFLHTTSRMKRGEAAVVIKFRGFIGRCLKSRQQAFTVPLSLYVRMDQK